MKMETFEFIQINGSKDKVTIPHDSTWHALIQTLVKRRKNGWLYPNVLLLVKGRGVVGRDIGLDAVVSSTVSKEPIFVLNNSPRTNRLFVLRNLADNEFSCDVANDVDPINLGKLGFLKEERSGRYDDILPTDNNEPYNLILVIYPNDVKRFFNKFGYWRAIRSQDTEFFTKTKMTPKFKTAVHNAVKTNMKNEWRKKSYITVLFE